MTKVTMEEIYVEPERESNDFLRFAELMERLGWNTYPTHVTGEEINAGNNSDEATAQTIEVPVEDESLFEFLNECGVFDNL